MPGAELVYRFADLVPSPDTTVIVNCGGRTRSIIGAQSLINAGVRNKVVSLKDGTMAWHLAGLDVVHGATRRPPDVTRSRAAGGAGSARRKWPRAATSRASTGTRSKPGAPKRPSAASTCSTSARRRNTRPATCAARGSAPGGQLVQETDCHIATWGARVVLVDDNGVRATMTASWLKQMGWHDVAVLVAGPADGDWETGRARAARARPRGVAVPGIAATDLRDRLAAGDVAVDRSRPEPALCAGPYSRRLVRHPRRASREGWRSCPPGRPIVLTSSDGALARLAAAELQAAASVPVLALAGGTAGLGPAGLPLETGMARMVDQADDVFLSPRDRGQNREEAMREYLAWEINLVKDMATDDDHRFRVVAD